MKTIARHPRVTSLPDEAQKPLYQKERIIKGVLEQRPFDTRRIASAARELGISPASVRQLVDGYVQYREVYGDERAVDYFRPRGRRVLPQVEMAISRCLF